MTVRIVPPVTLQDDTLDVDRQNAEHQADDDVRKAIHGEVGAEKKDAPNDKAGQGSEKSPSKG